MPVVPVLPVGVSRHFWAVAYVYAGASPNRENKYKYNLLYASLNKYVKNFANNSEISGLHIIIAIFLSIPRGG